MAHVLLLQHTWLSMMNTMFQFQYMKYNVIVMSLQLKFCDKCICPNYTCQQKSSNPDSKVFLSIKILQDLTLPN